jgi:deoxyribonuclease (pyrimidine dimer)
MDQHLFAEWREIKMIPKSLARSLTARGEAGVLLMVPPTFRLNTGHVSFYDKGAYLRRRYKELTDEVLDRGVHSIDRAAELDSDRIFFTLPRAFHKEYDPTEEARAEVRDRIALRISQRPNWYRYKGRLVGGD